MESPIFLLVIITVAPQSQGSRATVVKKQLK